jgi:hypothetical protein
MTEKFDPNTKGPPPEPRYATYCTDRWPKWKVHKRIGDAKSAVKYHKKNGSSFFEGITLYKWDAKYKEWYEIVDE